MSENPKIDYCLSKTNGTALNKATMTCSQVQYNKINTGGNDPSMSQKMRYAQIVRSSKTQTGFLNR
jgi:hypothetical protein